jgi:hypothetical protein
VVNSKDFGMDLAGSAIFAARKDAAKRSSPRDNSVKLQRAAKPIVRVIDSLVLRFNVRPPMLLAHVRQGPSSPLHKTEAAVAAGVL